MKIGTDAVLLGAFVNLDKYDHHILDVGSGSGILPLMLAQKASHGSIIDGIEINEDAALESIENVKLSKWAHQIRIINADASQWQPQLKYQVIVSNPPFFEEETHSANLERAKVRSTLTLGFNQLLDLIVKALDRVGVFYVILPYSASKEFIFKAGIRNLFLTERLAIRNTEKVPYKREILKFEWNAPSQIIQKSIEIRDLKNNYSEAFKDLTKDYYLHF
jgi:tRNA1Val (adenine37-N6)-methyltransferase